MAEPSFEVPPSERPSEKRLESWKEIAAYLKRDVTTVQRWERSEGLPVHRQLHQKLGSVYAYAAELDSWRNKRVPATGIGTAEVSQVAEGGRRDAHWRRATALGALSLALFAGGLTWLAHDRTTKKAAGADMRIRSLAVLPLQNFSGNPEQDYLSDGMTEALIARLSTIQGLRVISRTSAMQFKDTRKTVPVIGKELHVDAVIEGSVLRAGDKIRVTVQLIRTDTDEHLWANTYDRELRDVLALQSDVTRGIARHIEIAVTGTQEAQSVLPRTVAPEVYELYLKGRFALHKNNRAGLEDALGYFQAAIKADSAFAPAYAGVAAVQSQLGTVFFGAPPADTRPQVIAASRKALELDPELTEARVLLADTLQKDWQWREAEAEFRRSIELSPSDAAAHDGLGQWLACQGRIEEALTSARRAEELDPSVYRGREVGWILFEARRYDEAIRELRTALTETPEDPLTVWYLGFALVGAQHSEEAIRKLEEAASLSNRSSAVLGVLIHAYVQGGRRSDALRVLEELQRRRQKGYVPPAAFLNAYLGLGDTEQAFVWMERCAEEHSNIMQFLKVHPFFDSLRGDPRFAEYLRRANLSF